MNINQKGIRNRLESTLLSNKLYDRVCLETTHAILGPLSLYSYF